MNVRRVLLDAAILVAVGIAQPTLAEPTPALTDKLEPFSYFLGDWEIDATWSWGATLSGRNEFRVGLAGRFMEQRTLVSDNGGPMYERYRTIYAYDPERGYVAHGGSADGSFTTVDLDVETDDDGRLVAMQIETEQPNGAVLRNRVERGTESEYAWIVHMRQSADADWQPMMDDTWVRSTEEDAVASPIDPGLFVGSGTELRQFTKEAEISASPSEVFACWTTSDGWSRVFPNPDSAANIDLEIGGRYEWLFDGAIGSNGCQVLSYVPDRMVSFSWNAPPQQPESRAKRTWVVVEVEARDGGSHLRLTHLGFGEGPAWDETYDYFDQAWEMVLSRIADSFAQD